MYGLLVEFDSWAHVHIPLCHAIKGAFISYGLGGGGAWQIRGGTELFGVLRWGNQFFLGRLIGGGLISFYY